MARSLNTASVSSAEPCLPGSTATTRNVEPCGLDAMTLGRDRPRDGLLVLSQSHNCSLSLRLGVPAAPLLGALEQSHTCHEATTVLRLEW